MFLQRIPKKPRRASRWKSQAHLGHVRKHACVNCGSVVNIEAAHVRMGSGAGIGTKPDDWRTVSLCQFHHAQQHRVGEETFWRGFDVEALIAEFIKASPKKHEIEKVMKERGL
jgi:hypothetical protein